MNDFETEDFRYGKKNMKIIYKYNNDEYNYTSITGSFKYRKNSNNNRE